MLIRDGERQSSLHEECSKLLKTLGNLVLYFLIVAIVLSLLIRDVGAGIMAALILCIYMYPAYLSQCRGHPQQNSITTLNFFLGWTILGWIGALIWAWGDFDPSRKKETPIDLFRR
jgi:hypothetical protein